MKDTERPELILASASPRRQEMLLGLGLAFRIIVSEAEETPQEDELPAAYVVRVSRDKAAWVAERLEEGKSSIVIAGDTDVVMGRRILGKPGDEDDAKAMLRDLSGRTHEVISGLCVLGVEAGKVGRERSLAVTTEVQFKELSEAEIDAYVGTGEPMDKAGAYAIQGGANYMVKRIDGSHTNVIGMPLTELVDILVQDFDYTWR